MLLFFPHRIAVLTDGPSDVLIKVHETAHFECHFHSSLNFTLCEWRKGDDVLTVSEKFNFSPVPQKDPVNPDDVVCSLDVLDVTMDDIGNYTCIAYHNISDGFPMKRTISSNVGRAEIMLDASASNHCITMCTYLCLIVNIVIDNESSSSDDNSLTKGQILGIIFGSGSGSVGVIGIVILILQKTPLLQCLSKYLCGG